MGSGTATGESVVVADEIKEDMTVKIRQGQHRIPFEESFNILGHNLSLSGNH